MKKLLRRLRDLFCYCGVSKETYRDLKKEAYVSNFKVWKHLHCALLVGFCLLTVILTIIHGVTDVTLVQMFMVGYFAATSILFTSVYREDSLRAQFNIYLTMILLLVMAMLINRIQPQSSTVTFTVMLVMMPMFMIDKPYFMAILLVGAVAVYLPVIRPTRAPEDFDQFQEGSRHENVLRGLAASGDYAVNYRAYKYGQLVHYQTRYTLDRKDPKRIIIGLRCVGPAEKF